MESPDRVTLYSVNWTLDADSAGPHLDAILDGSVSTRRDALKSLGSLAVEAPYHTSIAAWVYDGVTRPFAGMRCDNPHHALLFRRGDDALAVAICFECATLSMKGNGHGAKVRRADVRWDRAFRDFLRAQLEVAGIPDMSSDIMP